MREESQSATPARRARPGTESDAVVPARNHRHQQDRQEGATRHSRQKHRVCGGTALPRLINPQPSARQDCSRSVQMSPFFRAPASLCKRQDLQPVGLPPPRTRDRSVGPLAYRPTHSYTKPSFSIFGRSYTFFKSTITGWFITDLSRPRSRLRNWFHSTASTKQSAPEAAS